MSSPPPLPSSLPHFFFEDRLKSSGWSLGEEEGKRLSKEGGILKRLLYMSREEDEGTGMLYRSSNLATEALGECLECAFSSGLKDSLV